jgi:hypothetical protein
MTTRKPKMQTVDLPLDQTPHGRGWTLHSGGLHFNTWQRRKPVKRVPTLDQLVDNLRSLTRSPC